MINPLVVERTTVAELPSVAEIVELARREPWLRFEVLTVATVAANGERQDPTTPEWERLMHELTPLLPQHEMWIRGFLPDAASLPAARINNDGTRLTGTSAFLVRLSISDEAIEQNLRLLVAAAAEYRTLTNRLMARLARQLGIDVASFAADESWHVHAQTGHLYPERSDRQEASGYDWRYFFHGVDCKFTQAETGVTIEAALGFGAACGGNEFGAFDEGFFLRFVESRVATRSEFLPIVTLLGDWHKNAMRAFRFMELRGLLRQVVSAHAISRRWVLTPRAGTTDGFDV